MINLIDQLDPKEKAFLHECFLAMETNISRMHTEAIEKPSAFFSLQTVEWFRKNYTELKEKLFANTPIAQLELWPYMLEEKRKIQSVQIGKS